MADFSVRITVPDDKVADLSNALHDYFGKNQDGTQRTNQELKAAFDAEVRRMLRRMYERHMLKQQRPPALGETA